MTMLLSYLRPAALLALVALASACQSSRPAFFFQPLTLSPPPPARPAAPVETGATSVVPLEALAEPARPPRASAPVVAAPAALALAPAPAPAARPLPGWVARKLTKQLTRRPATEGAAEAGLGRTVLTLLAMVLGALAGLAALLSLLPGVSFWGGLGLAVGGLVVLFLLFKLFGGKK